MNIPTRTILKVLGVTAAFIGALWLAHLAIHVLVWIGTAAFLALAINPAVEAVASRLPGHKRGSATAIVYVAVLAFLVLFLITLIPPLADQIQSFARNLPHRIDQITNGNNEIARLVHQYNLTDQIKKSQNELTHSASRASGALFSLATTFFRDFAAAVTVLVLTFFLLLEGPRWLELFWRLHPEQGRERNQRLAGKMYQAVVGYVVGNLLTSLLAAVLTTIMLFIFRVPYAISLGILVGLIDLLPLVGATIAAIVVVTVAFFTSTIAGIGMLIFFFVYQQSENHFLQPIIYGKTVQMSPFLVLAVVLIGASIGGMLGALVAIPIGACLQIVAREVIEARSAH